MFLIGFHRFLTDFYQYLQISEKSAYKQISTCCKKLIIQWKTAEKHPDLNEEARQKLQELLEGIRMVHNTLTKPDLREEYDKRKKKGRAPKVELIKAGTQKKIKSPPPTPEIELTNQIHPLKNADIQ